MKINALLSFNYGVATGALAVQQLPLARNYF